MIKFIAGGAIGVDTWAAQAVIELGGWLVLYIPNVGQQNTWPVESQLEWLTIFRDANEVVWCDKGEYQPYKMMKRNKMMVDSSELVIAVWNGDKDGGTANCVNYAIREQKDIKNLWPEIQALLSQDSQKENVKKK